MKYIVTLNGKNYEIDVEQGGASVLSAGGAAVSAPVFMPASIAAAGSTPAPAPMPVSAAPDAVQPPHAPAPASAGEEVIQSPIPGIVLSVAVSAGAAVKRGDVLLVIEAMKMDNEILAPRDGTVSSVSCSSGDTVVVGDPLVSLV